MLICLAFSLSRGEREGPAKREGEGAMLAHAAPARPGFCPSYPNCRQPFAEATIRLGSGGRLRRRTAPARPSTHYQD